MDDATPKTAQVAKASDTPWEQRFVDKRHAKDKTSKSVAELFWQDIQGIGSNVLQEAGKSGSASKADLAKSIESGKLKGDEALVAAALYKQFDLIKSGGFMGLSQAKISQADIATLAQKSSTAEKEFVRIDHLTAWAEDHGNLKRFSKNGSGSLALSDIGAAQKQAGLSTDDKAMLSELNANFKSIASNGKIGKTEIDSYYSNFTKNADFKLTNHFKIDMIYVETNQQNPQAHMLFADQSNPVKSVRAESVLQGMTGDCSFKAALAGLAAARPQEIVNMIKADGSAKLTVHLPGTKEKSFSVSPPTDEELGLFNNKAIPDGFWPALLTKAYGESEFSRANPLQKSKMNSETEDEWAGERGDQAGAIEAITGNQVFKDHVADLTDSELTEKLLGGQKDKRVMVLSTVGDGKTPDGFKAGHALTVTNVSNLNGKLEVTVRDPQAHGDNRPDGTLKISLQTLKKNFDAVFIETKDRL